MASKSILIVEDDEIVRTMIKNFLEREYNVIEASRYSEAVNKLRNNIDLALIDYALPDRDGFELVKTIRQIKAKLPVIMMTAYGTEAIAIKALKAGIIDYIKKPMKLTYLMKRVSEALNGLSSEFDFESAYAGSRKEFIMDSGALYLEENYMEDFSLEKTAGRLGMNKFNFCRLFKQRFGQGFISYLNNIRVKNASELLKNPSLNITEIAYVVGYKSLSQFERTFKKTYGIPPREYRKGVNEKP